MPTTRHTRTAALAVATAALALTAACGTQHGTDAAGEGHRAGNHAPALPDAKDRAAWPRPNVEHGLAKGMRLPLESYMLGYPAVVDVENARDIVKQQCMQRLGFQFTPNPSGTQPAASYDAINMERRYGITDPAKAAAHGFALAQNVGDPSETEEDAELAREDQESSVEGWDKAMNETCIPEANKTVGVLFPTDVAGDLAAQSLKATREQPVVQRGLASWSSCMAGRGHQVKSLDDAEGRFARPEGAGAQPQKAEVSMATDDVACKKTVGLVATWYKTETAYQIKQIEEHREELEAEKAHDAGLVKKARAVLARYKTAR
ncbi:hypothetical protein GCM10018980_35190 [Streptomyces capoamus]|uniref:Lipoprotein n=1 Tax=Streptomyces capoamus TaxID=68183 RepID=A0A919C556_9ACTN|nr:hypothetical protein [Streptomyces capoamus]GGW10536.1 hypothetical protein GCM10010501_05800 [Streptomyces libani subsp. rufus]GHG51985.1 hypothetical protein GCM10018980_35190 [Streptomyces capoamus]